MSKWMEVFRTGKHTASNGTTREWTEADLNKIAASYKPDNHEAPIVIGHPKDNAPAYGWIDQLKVVGRKLMALPTKLEPQFTEMVNAGRFKKRSISVYPDGSLRHVGFLGASAPAIKGLKDVSFGEDKEWSTYEYQDMEDTMPTVEELQAKLDQEKTARLSAEATARDYKEKVELSEADLAEEQKNLAEERQKNRRAEVDNFIESGIKESKILPAWKDLGLAEFMVSLDEQTVAYEFAEGKDKQTPGAWFKKFITSFGEHPLFKEMAKPNGDDKRTDDSSFAEDEKIAHEIAGIENK